MPYKIIKVDRTINKENIFEQIGKATRKKKEEGIRIAQRYWKLPPLERIHYDLIRERILRNKIQPFLFTGLVTWAFFFLSVLLASWNIIIGKALNWNIIAIFYRLISLFFLALCIDFLCFFYQEWKQFRIIKKLNKRFKLE